MLSRNRSLTVAAPIGVVAPIEGGAPQRLRRHTLEDPDGSWFSSL